MELKRRSFITSLLRFLGLVRLIGDGVPSKAHTYDKMVVGHPMWLDSKVEDIGNGTLRFCVPNGGVKDFTPGMWIGELPKPPISPPSTIVLPNPFVSNWVDPVKVDTPLEALMKINPVDGILEEAKKGSQEGI